MNNNSEKSIISNLWERRVPQYLATYIGVSWGITQFMIFASNRYGLDSTYIDKFLLFILIFLPAIILFTYNHGRPGHDNWTKKEKLIIPFNFLLAIGIASFAGKGNTMQAATSEVTITTVEGDTITRLVPSIAQTKSFALFPFKNNDSNADNDWMRFAIPQLIGTDLEQDIRLYCMNPFGMEYQYGSQKYQLTDDIPFSSKLKISKDKIAQYFVDGEFQKKGEIYTVNIKVIDCKSGEEFFSDSYTNSDIYQIIDDFNKSLSNNLFLKDTTNDLLEVIDLPSRDLISHNIDALKAYSLSMIDIKLNNNYESALSHALKAGKLDETSAEIKKIIAGNIYSAGDMSGAQKYMKEALQLSENLSERQKLSLKSIYYLYHQEVDKAIRLWETWRTLYPRDYYPFTQLMEFYTLTRNFGKAKNVGYEAIKSGHKSRILKRMANVCIQRDELEEAEQYLLEYLDLYPDKAKNDTQLAEIYEGKGELKKAEDYLEKIELLNPEDHNIMVKLSTVYQLQGNYDKAETYINKAYENATLVQDSVEVLFQKMMLYIKVAEKEKFRIAAKTRIKLMESYLPKIGVASQCMPLTGLYVQFGLENDLLEYFNSVSKEAPQVKFTFDCITGFIIALIKEDLELFKRNYTGTCKELLISSNKELEYISNGLIAKMEGNHKDAIRFIQLYIDSTGTGGKEYGSMLAEAYRKSGDPQSAIKACKDYLKKDVAQPAFLLELSAAQLDAGQKKAAKANYLRLVDIWKNIDSTYIYYDKFSELKEAFVQE